VEAIKTSSKSDRKKALDGIVLVLDVMENQLDMILRARRIENLVFFGVTTSGITLSTLRRAFLMKSPKWSSSSRPMPQATLPVST
jgi:nicotinamidase-related amidase